MAIEQQQQLILFDGVCNLCERWVQFVIRNDAAGRFRFASLQSDVARSILDEYRYSYDELSSFLLVADGRLYRKSRAALAVARQLDRPWPAVYYLVCWVPLFLADRVYDFIGSHRYRWFGKKVACWVPDPDVAARFIDQ